MLTVVAPAAITCSTTSTRKSGSVREASSAENSTSLQCERAMPTASTARRTTSARESLSLCSRWMGLVARKTWTRGRSASRRASQARSMSARVQRASAQTEMPRTLRAMACTDSKSPGEAAGKPASMTSTRSSSSAAATLSFSARFMLAPGACSPSRSVVSKMVTRWLSMTSVIGIKPRPGLRCGRTRGDRSLRKRKGKERKRRRAGCRGSWPRRRCAPTRGCRRGAAPR